MRKEFDATFSRCPGAPRFFIRNHLFLAQGETTPPSPRVLAIPMHRPSLYPVVSEILESRIAPAAAFALAADGDLFTFDTSTPSSGTLIGAITGVSATETLEGIDFRPSTGQLYLLTRDTALLNVGVGRLYIVDTSNAVATPVATLAADPADSSNAFSVLPDAQFGIDFNPAVDRLRVVSSTGENFRINVATGGVITDENINPPGASISGIAYNNIGPRSGATTLYGIDTATDKLVTINPPNNGTVNVVGDSFAFPTDVIGFDIGSDNDAFAVMDKEGEVRFYSVNLQSGFCFDLGTLGNGQFPIAGFSLAPDEPSGRSFTYRDVDGDVVTITTTRGDFDETNFVTAPAGSVGGVQLRSLVLNAAEFDGANITVTAVRGPLGGDGLANVGFLNAGGIDLGKVIIDGDLGKIVVGDATATDTSLTSLAAQSMGAFGVSTQAPGGNLASVITGNAGTITVAGDLDAASILVQGSVKTLTIGGNLEAGAAAGTGSVVIEGNLTTANVGGSLLGGAADDTGKLEVTGTAGKITVRGSLIGGGGAESGTIEGGISVKSIAISHDLKGGGGMYSGSIYTGGGAATDNGFIGSVTIGGDVTAGSHALTGIIVDATLGAVKIGGNVTGTAGATAKIIAEGLLSPTTAKTALAIKSISIAGKTEFADILAGYNITGVASNADVQIGTVTVRDWIASNLVVGVEANGGGFGTDDDDIFGGGENAAIPSRIASIVIKGQAFGTVGGIDGFGFVAEQIAKFKVGRQVYPLTANLDNLPVGPTGDLRVREYVNVN